MEEENRRYTAFVVPDGQWEFCKTPFGFANPSAVFQKHVRLMLKELMEKNNVCAYLDDLIITTKTEEEALRKLKLVLETAGDFGLVIN